MFSADGILGRRFVILSAGLDGIAERQEVRTQNLANINTEGYKARTVNFEDALQRAMKAPGHGVRVTGFDASPASRLPGGTADVLTAARLAKDFTVETSSTAGVDRNAETTEMASDNVRFRILTQQVTNQLSALKGVIAEMGRM